MTCGIEKGTFVQRGDLVFFTDRATGIVGGARVRSWRVKDVRIARRQAYEDCRRKIVQERFHAQLRAWSVCPKPAPDVAAVWLRRAA